MKTHLMTSVARLPALAPADLEKLQAFQRQEAAAPQVGVQTWHYIHAGMYARTLLVPGRVGSRPGIRIVGALTKVPTIVCVSGDAYVSVDANGIKRIKGHAVLLGDAGRKQIFEALQDTTITSMFPTQAKTVEEAEREFTDEELASHRDGAINHVIVKE